MPKTIAEINEKIRQGKAVAVNAEEIIDIARWIQSGKFLLTEPVEPLPGIESGVTFKPLNERPIEY